MKFFHRFFRFFFYFILASVLLACHGPNNLQETKIIPKEFNGEKAFADVQYQVNLGPRKPGSPSHDQEVGWIQSQLTQSGWLVEQQNTQRMNHPIQNVIGKWGQGSPWIIVGAHYDSRLVADQDPSLTNRTLPVPGANDGASGVAVLLELARDLPSHLGNQGDKGQIWLVFFDAEDNGEIPGWDWLLGSQAFIDSLPSKPDAAIIIDMIGDKDLNIFKEKNSNSQLTDEIWSQAANLGYSAQFISRYKYSMVDDHTPFLNAGIPAIDIIDFDYPFWHTRSDTSDKVSAQSLKAVGDILLAWLTNMK
jgi:Zn-dependent M28 family amino/carboxypeptidase